MTTKSLLQGQMSVLLLISMFVALTSSCQAANSGAPLMPVTKAAAQDGGSLSDDAIDSVGEKVMSGNDFRSVRRRVLEQIPESDVDKGFLLSALGKFGEFISDVFSAIGDFFTWLTSGFRSSPGTAPAGPPPSPATPASSGPSGPMGLSQLMTIMAIVAIAAVLMVLVAMIIKSIDAKKKRDGRLLSDSEDMLSDVVTPPGDLAVSTYESRAIQLAGAGDFRAAIRELLLGSMSWIERAGLIRYRKGLTNRDYLRSVWRRSEKRDAYLTTANQFELVFFGRRVPTVEMFETCLTSFRGSFREEETPTAAV